MRIRSVAVVLAALPWILSPPVFYPILFEDVWGVDGLWVGDAVTSSEDGDVVLPAKLTVRARNCPSAKHVFFQLDIGLGGPSHRLSRGSGSLSEDSDAIKLQEDSVTSHAGVFSTEMSETRAYTVMGDASPPDRLYIESSVFFGYRGFRVFLERAIPREDQES